MDIPYWLIGESGEKGCMYGFADLYDGTADVFTEPLLVANLFTESHTAYEDNLLTENCDFEDFAWDEVSVGRRMVVVRRTIFLP